MNNEQINIAIAESLGVPTKAGPYSYPYYCNDLNAMHEAEKALPLRSRKAYMDHLSYDDSTTGCVFGTVTSTARHRAEAYLRTIGRWVDA